MMTRTTGAAALVLLAASCAYGTTDEDSFGSALSEQHATGSGGSGSDSTSTPCPGTTSTTTTSSTTTSGTGTGTGTGAGTGTGTGTGTGGSTCDFQGDCDSCANCALGVDCVGEVSACVNSVECMDFFDCMDVCYDQACYDDCMNTFPVGFQLYMDMSYCAICDACPNDCAYEGQGICY